MFNKPKKLKKIPSDLVSYIQIETEAIKDANDKMMISSYCLSKLETVNWYLELLEVGSRSTSSRRAKRTWRWSEISSWPVTRQSWP